MQEEPTTCDCVRGTQVSRLFCHLFHNGDPKATFIERFQ